MFFWLLLCVPHKLLIYVLFSPRSREYTIVVLLCLLYLGGCSQRLVESYVGISKTSMQRSMRVDQNVVLNIFWVASTLAYGAAAYLTGKASLYFVTANERLAPIKKLMSPWLELQSMLRIKPILSLFLPIRRCLIDNSFTYFLIGNVLIL